MNPKSLLFLIFSIYLTFFSLAQEMKPSSLYIIEDIHFLGNKKTKERIISRELSFKSGDSVPKKGLDSLLERNRVRINNLRLFNTVKISHFETENDKIQVIVEVEERWYSIPALIFKPVDDKLADWWRNRNGDFSRVNYGVGFGHFNMRGRGEKLRISAQFGFSQNFRLQYSIPYIDRKQSLGIRVATSYSQYRTLDTITVDHVKHANEHKEEVILSTLNTKAVIKKRIGFYQFHFLELGYQNHRFTDSLILKVNDPDYFPISSNEPPTYENNSFNYFYASYLFQIDRRDYSIYPLKGYDLNLFIKRLGLGMNSDLNQTILNFNYKYFKPLDDKFYVGLSIRGVYSTPNEQGYSNFLSLGRGRNLLRGFDARTIEGPIYALAKTEIKKSIFNKNFDLNGLTPFEQFKTMPTSVYLKLFWDIGYVQNYENYERNSRLTNTPLYSAGIGADLVTFYDLVIRLEYSYNNSEPDLNDFWSYTVLNINLKAAL